MKKFDFDDKIITVHFVKLHPTRKGRQMVDTECHIRVEVKNNYEIFNLYVMEARQHPKDRYNQLTGKIISFKRCMNAYMHTLLKSERKIMWIAFAECFNIKWDQ